MQTVEALKVYLTHVPRAARDIIWISAWDENKTIIENCRILKIPSSAVGHNLCYKFKLGFREGFHRVVKTDQESIQTLLDNGLKRSEIARLLGVSNQRICQILNKKASSK